jgi:hypothetical protein
LKAKDSSIKKAFFGISKKLFTFALRSRGLAVRAMFPFIRNHLPLRSRGLAVRAMFPFIHNQPKSPI